MDKEQILFTIPLKEFETIQKAWFLDVLKSTEIPREKEEQLITRKETAQLLGISLPTLNEYSKKGIIPAYYLGSRVRYKKSEILDALVSFQKYRRRD